MWPVKVNKWAEWFRFKVISSFIQSSVTTVAAIDNEGELVTIEKWDKVGIDVLELYLESVGVGIGKIIQA